ncbi:MAG: YggU family protein [Acidobacteria bacterium]|nr:YggU family protein [Acidobacteriota bacterium]
MIKIAAKDNGISFSVRVQPRASRTDIAGELEGVLKIRLAAPPVDGEANEELIRFLAKLFGISRSQIVIRSGQTSRNKLIAIDGISVEKGGQVLQTALDE